MKIFIKGFRGIENKEFTFVGPAVMTGKNGRGKTSVVDAIRWAFTGNMTKSNIRENSDEAYVEVKFDDGFTFSRKVKKDGIAAVCKLYGKTVTATALKAAIEEKFGCFTESIDACIGIGTFNAKDLSTSLAQYLSEMTPEEVLFYGNIEAENEKEFLSFFEGKAKISIADILAAYKTIYAERKAANALIKELKAYPSVVKPAHTAAETKEAIERCGKQRDLFVAAAKSEEFHRKAELIENEIKGWSERLAAFPAVVPDVDENLNKTRSEMNELLVLKTTATENSKSLQKTIEALEKGVCPIHEKMKCTSPKTSLIGELQEAVILSNDSALKYADRIKELTERQNALEAARKSNAERKDAESIIEHKKLLLESLKVEEVVIPAGVTLESVEEEIDRLQGVLRDIVRYEEGEKRASALKDAEAKKVRLEAYLSATAGDGVIVSCKYDEYARDINEKIAAYNKTKYVVNVVADDGIKVLVKVPGSEEFRPFASLSSGEQATTGIMVLNCIGSVAGVPFLVVDGVEVIDGDNFDDLFDFVKELKEYEFVLLTRVK